MYASSLHVRLDWRQLDITESCKCTERQKIDKWNSDCENTTKGFREKLKTEDCQESRGIQFSPLLRTPAENMFGLNLRISIDARGDHDPVR